MKVRKSMIVALAAGALAIPAAAVAHPGHGHGHGHANAHANGQGSNHPVSYVFKGTYDGSGLVTVNHGNAHVRKAGLVGTDVQFDLTNTKFIVADTNSDQVIDVNDVLTGDNVVVKARLPRQDPGSQPFAARQLVDQTNPADSTDTTDTADSGDSGDGA